MQAFARELAAEVVEWGVVEVAAGVFCWCAEGLWAADAGMAGDDGGECGEEEEEG